MPSKSGARADTKRAAVDSGEFHGGFFFTKHLNQYQMKSLEEIKQQKEKGIDSLIKKCRVFFAFSNDQFKENKTELPEGDKFAHIGAGTYLPKTMVDNFLNGLEALNKAFNASINEHGQIRREHIAYELSSHESYYTGDIEEAIEALGPNYTRTEVQKVYHETRNCTLLIK